MKKCKKFTDEELSRILSEHAAGTLVRLGAKNFNLWLTNMLYPMPACCVNQAAYNECDILEALDMNAAAAVWFDNHYSRFMTPEELLENLERIDFNDWK